MHFSPPLSTWECCQNWETWGQLREPVLGQAAARRVRAAMWILLPPTRETISCLAQKYRGGQRGAAGKGTQLHLAQTEQKWVIGLFSMKENSFSCVAACLPAGFPSRWKTTLSVTIEAAVEVEEKQGWGCGQGVLAGQGARGTAQLASPWSCRVTVAYLNKWKKTDWVWFKACPRLLWCCFLAFVQV